MDRRGHQMVGSSYLILKGLYLLYLLPIHYAIPSLSTMLLLYSIGCYLFIFLCVLGWKRVGRLESNQQRRCLLALPAVRRAFDAIRAVPHRSQGTPIPLLSLSRVTVGAVFLAPV